MPHEQQREYESSSGWLAAANHEERGSERSFARCSSSTGSLEFLKISPNDESQRCFGP